MKTEIFAKNYKVSNKLEDLIVKKLERLDKYFDGNVRARVNLKQEKETYTLELTINADKVLRAEVSSTEDMYTNLDMAISKISRQITKYKSRFAPKYDAGFESDMAEYLNTYKQPPSDNKVVRKKMYQLKPMNVQEAQMQMELVGHDFFVFLDADSDNINVLYKRNDGNVGLIETTVG